MSSFSTFYQRLLTLLIISEGGFVRCPIRWRSDHLAVKSFFGSVIMRIAYGSSDTKLNKARISEVEHLVDSFVQLLRPGRLLVDFIPVLRHVPAWLPGAGWRRELERVRSLAYQVANVPYDDAKERLVSN
jgi:hypothetical protein